MSGPPSKLVRAGARIAEAITVLRVVDGGGKEPVYIVWHHESWCPMACKVYRTQAGAEREAKVLGSLAHPYIVRLLGLEEPGLLLMEFIEGQTLASMIDEARAHRLGVSDAMRVAIHLAAALQHVHARGFIHLDVKPANVMISGNGRPILFDFGSARGMDALRPGRVTGTDLYIAPEECALGEATPASDVFSFGVSLYEMLTGEVPFGKGTEADPFPQTSREAIPARRLRPSLPKELDALVLSCLAREPERRPDLHSLTLSLHGFICIGPKMWPDGFNPGAKRRRARNPSAGQTKAASRSARGNGATVDYDSVSYAGGELPAPAKLGKSAEA
jgi:serine/threonine protein kinase